MKYPERRTALLVFFNTVAAASLFFLLSNISMFTSVFFILPGETGQSDGGVLSVSAGHGYPSFSVIMCILFAVSVTFIAAAFIYNLRYLYIYILKRRIPIFLKLGVTFFTVLMISIATISAIILATTGKAYESEIRDKLAILAQAGVRQIDGDALRRLTRPEHFMNRDYVKLLNQMKDILNDNRDEWNRNISSVLYKKIDGNYYYAVNPLGRQGVLCPVSAIHQVHIDACEKGEVGHLLYRDDEGERVCAVAPVRDRNGVIAGVYEAGTKFFMHSELKGVIIGRIAIGAGIAGFIQIIIFFMFSYSLLSSMKKLYSAGRQIAAGDFTVRTDIHTHDEIEDLGNEFNRMAAHLGSFVDEVGNLYEEIEITQREVIYRLSEVAEARSKETGNHVRRVVEFTKILAEKYSLEAKEIRILKLGAAMHDIGKLGIPDAILHKPDKLTVDEFNIMKIHTQIGNEMLKTSRQEIFRSAAIVAHQHHERYDGEGYPRGLKENEIHIYGRIVAVADVFDSLASNRCYKRAWDLESILDLFDREKGRQFDPDLVEILLRNLQAFISIRDKYRDE